MNEFAPSLLRLFIFVLLIAAINLTFGCARVTSKNTVTVEELGPIGTPKKDKRK